MEQIYTEEEINYYTADLIRKIASPQMIYPWANRKYDLIDFFPSDLEDYMDDFICAEINDIGNCIQNNLWTPATLMAFRVFEDTVKIHVAVDLKINCKKLKLHDAVRHMKNTFKSSFVRELLKLNKKRNKGMHPKVRFDHEEALEVIELVVWIVMFVYSIPPED